MKTKLTLLVAVGGICASNAQICISADGIQDASGSSVVLMVNQGQIFIRTAHVDSATLPFWSTRLIIKDYAGNGGAMLGQATLSLPAGPDRLAVTNLSRDGRGVAMFGSVGGDSRQRIIYCPLPAASYVGTLNLLTFQVSPFEGQDDLGNLAPSTTILSSTLKSRVGISNLVGGGQVLVWKDLNASNGEPGGSPYSPVMWWNTATGTVGWDPGSDDWGEPAINSSGGVLAYTELGQVKRATGPVGAWSTGTVTLISQYAGFAGNGTSKEPQIDGPGSKVVFASNSMNFAPGASGAFDVFWGNGGSAARAYSTVAGEEGTGVPNISDSGTWITFESYTRDPGFAPGVVYGNLLGPFIFRVPTSFPVNLALVSRLSSSANTARRGYWPSILSNGRTVFDSFDTGMATGDARLPSDVIYRP